jgi:mono/diheme cytochrome c family protein
MRPIRSLAVPFAVAAIALGTVTAVGARQQPGGARASEPSSGASANVDTDEDAQPRTLPTPPSGMTIQMIVQGDSIFHSKGGCVTCHGPDAGGMPASGSAVTRGLGFIPAEWRSIDSLITAGIPEEITRSPIAMPARGAQSNLTPEETRLVAAYVWAITHVRGEPWPGGHRTHVAMTARAADTSSAAGAANPRP